MFLTNVLQTKDQCEGIKKNATLERLRLEKRQTLITEKSINSSKTLSERQADRSRFKIELDSSRTKVATLPEGKDKEQLKVYIKELEWRISKLELYEIKAASPVDVVQEAYDVEETIVLLDLVNRFIAAIDARIAEIPAV
jgi:ABC-type phosphate transport system auxiliary subunit